MAKKVLIAMSGGVDSSVAAALLTRQGYDCVGAFFITWTESMPGLTMCPWERDAYDARLVCGQLGIPFYTFDFEQAYRERVIEYFFKEYQSGRTPNPDVLCNREIKFGLFAEKARELGIEFIATGHYARLVRRRGIVQLRKGRDRNKDQSYFLYALNQAQLSKALFPIGNLEKERVRAIAKEWHLPNWMKKDSQGICFLGQVQLIDFLKTRLPENPGNIVDLDGNVLGEHDGIMFYTIGQRHGLKIGGAGTPYYVVAKNESRNELVVSHRENPEAPYSKQLIAVDPTWVSEQPKLPLRCAVKIRYRQADQPARVEQGPGKSLLVAFRHPQWAVAPGQAVVFYRRQRLLGGATIERTAA